MQGQSIYDLGVNVVTPIASGAVVAGVIHLGRRYSHFGQSIAWQGGLIALIQGVMAVQLASRVNVLDSPVGYFVAQLIVGASVHSLFFLASKVCVAVPVMTLTGAATAITTGMAVSLVGVACSTLLYLKNHHFGF